MIKPARLGEFRQHLKDQHKLGPNENEENEALKARFPDGKVIRFQIIIISFWFFLVPAVSQAFQDTKSLAAPWASQEDPPWGRRSYHLSMGRLPTCKVIYSVSYNTSYFTDCCFCISNGTPCEDTWGIWTGQMSTLWSRHCQVTIYDVLTILCI